MGDCGNSGEVTVDEILTLINIALENLPISACTAGDANGDGTITIDEILIAVNNALGGCGMPVSFHRTREEFMFTTRNGAWIIPGHTDTIDMLRLEVAPPFSCQQARTSVETIDHRIDSVTLLADSRTR